MSSGAGAMVESGSSRSGKGSDETGGFQELFRINQLLYRLPPTLSIVSKRTLLQNFFTKSAYTNPNETIWCTFSTGEYYVAPKTSYLYIEIGFKDPNLAPTAMPPVNAYLDAFASIPQGDIMSLFYEPLFFASSGTELCRETEKGLISAIESRYKYDQQYIDTYGQAQGMPLGKYSQIWDGTGPTGDFKNPFKGSGGSLLPPVGQSAGNLQGKSLQNICISGGTNTNLRGFIVPMNKLLGLFNPYNDCLLPAGMLAGSRFELRLKNPVESLFASGLVSNNYFQQTGVIATSALNGLNPNLQKLTNSSNYVAQLQISNIYFVLDAFQLQDAVLKRLNQTAAGQDGLSLLFDTHDYTPYTTTAGQFEAQVSQARSRVVRSICHVRDTANIGNPYINSYASEPAVYRVSSKLPAGSRANFGDIFNGGGPDVKWANPGTTWYSNSTVVAQKGDAANMSGAGGSFTGATDTLAGWRLPTSDIVNAGFCEIGTFSQQHDVLKCGALTPPMGMVTAPVACIEGAQIGSVKCASSWATTIIPAHPADPFTGTGGAPASGTPVVISYQAQLGALFFPQQPFTRAVEHYFNALYMYGKSMASKDTACSVTYEDFLGGYGWNLNSTANGTAQASYGAGGKIINMDPTFYNGTFDTVGNSNLPYIYPYGMAIYGALFEKNQLLEMSGLPISNARLLRHKFQFGDSTSLSGLGRTVSVFTTFTRAVKVFLGGLCVVRE